MVRPGLNLSCPHIMFLFCGFSKQWKSSWYGKTLKHNGCTRYWWLNSKKWKGKKETVSENKQRTPPEPLFSVVLWSKIYECSWMTYRNYLFIAVVTFIFCQFGAVCVRERLRDGGLLKSAHLYSADAPCSRLFHNNNLTKYFTVQTNLHCLLLSTFLLSLVKFNNPCICKTILKG